MINGILCFKDACIDYARGVNCLTDKQRERVTHIALCCEKEDLHYRQLRADVEDVLILSLAGTVLNTAGHVVRLRNE